MIQVTPQMRIRVALAPVDFRRGIDGLAQLCRADLKEDPFQGTLFVFRNRPGTAIKALVYDGQGFWLLQKRLSAGRFRHWPDHELLEAHELSVLLAAGDPARAQGAPQWRRVRAPA